MPLMDHFHGPMLDELPWETLHSSWASDLARGLNRRWLRRPFRAMEQTHAGARIEVDVATVERVTAGTTSATNGGAVATLPRVWTAPAPVCSEPIVFPDTFEVRVFEGPGSWHLVGAIELVSPGNKDTAERRQAFVTKCASYLHAGVSVVVIDVITYRHANLHNQLLDLLGITGTARLPDDAWIYATAYRPVQRGDRSEFDIWRERCQVGAALPTMPLRLTGDLFVPVEFELAYVETCESHQLL
jgi:hypothetical protein